MKVVVDTVFEVFELGCFRMKQINCPTVNFRGFRFRVTATNLFSKLISVCQIWHHWIIFWKSIQLVSVRSAFHLRINNVITRVQLNFNWNFCYYAINEYQKSSGPSMVPYGTPCGFYWKISMHSPQRAHFSKRIISLNWYSWLLGLNFAITQWALRQMIIKLREILLLS